jgi:hypothetical protein
MEEGRMTATRFHTGDVGYEHVAAFGSAPNPHSGAWNYEAGTTKRLQMLCGARVPFWNLFVKEPDNWSRESAARAATSWVETHEEDLVLMLGAKVCRAFGVMKPSWLEVYDLDYARTMQGVAVPHPSGLNRWYNDADNVRAAKYILRAMVDA